MRQSTIESASEYLAAVFVLVIENKYDPFAVSDLRRDFRERKNEELMLIPLSRAEILTKIYETYDAPANLNAEPEPDETVFPEFMGIQTLLEELAALSFRLQYEEVKAYFDEHPDLFFDDI